MMDYIWEEHNVIIHNVTCQVDGVDVGCPIDPPVRVAAGQRVRIGVFEGKAYVELDPEIDTMPLRDYQQDAVAQLRAKPSPARAAPSTFCPPAAARRSSPAR